MPSIKRVPVPLINHRLTPEQLLRESQSARAECDKALASIVALSDASRTFANTAEAMERAIETYADAVQRMGILRDVHPNQKVREAAAQVEENAGKYLVQIASRRDLYKAMKGWLAGSGQREVLDPQQRRLVELMMRDFRRNGLELGEKELARLVELRTRLTELSTSFAQNLNENTDNIEMTEAELAGLPPSFVERLVRAKSGNRVVTTKYPDVYPFMENAKNREARKRLYIAFQNREAERNLPLLAEAIALRDEEAKLLGFATHSDFVTEDQMAKNATKVKSFLSSLKEQLRPRRDSDFAKMTALLRAGTGDAQAELKPWDVSYYLNEIKKREFSLDNEAIREYFPAETVLSGMFEVYQTLLGIEIREAPGADVWAPEVKLFEIRDRSGGELQGLFYIDLYPRPGKYGHAASAPATLARELGGVYQAPISVLLGNFNPPAQGRPSLLSHEEVKTLFHEFGHIMHQTLTRARYGNQSGTAVARDFVEVPSQMLENWVYEKQVLDRMSGHWQDRQRKLPEDIVARIKKARAFDAGYRYTRQVFLASFDQELHTAGPQVDIDSIDRKLYTDIIGLPFPAQTHFAASFGHLMGGYDAGYYGYLWAEVYADDMFARFQKEGILNPDLGRRYREIILARGRTEEPDALLRQFLGGEPSNKAFLKKLGLN
jgi:thimet oligopeptidase